MGVWLVQIAGDAAAAGGRMNGQAKKGLSEKLLAALLLQNFSLLFYDGL